MGHVPQKLEIVRIREKYDKIKVGPIPQK
jgi:hypothetical protein